MSSYYTKLLELKGIENRDKKYYLRINFTSQETIEIFLEIDKYTANNLKNIVEFNDIYKYRLSFKTLNDDFKKQYVGVIRQTFKDTSKTIYFLCSKDYIDKLASLKNIEDINDVDKLSFILRKASLKDERLDYKHTVKDDNERPFKFSYISTAIISLALILVFGYLGNLYLNKSYFNDGVLAESIELNLHVGEDILSEPMAYSNITDYNMDRTLYQEEKLEREEITIENSSSIEDEIPFIELDDTLIYGLPEGKVALTFDDGPSQYTKEIIDILREYNVGGTFFLTGYNVKKYPDHVKYIHSNGYTIGSHSMNHFNMSKLSYEKQKNELIDSIEMLEEIIDEDVLLFRPPYGSYNKQLVDLAIEHEYKIVLWNNDPEDWKSRDVDKIFEAIKNTNTSGAIILLHESQAVIDALPKIIEYLQDLKLEIVSLK